jgi:hypothetical protein
MDFGRVPENELSKVDFKLPSEPPMNQLVLKGKRVKNPETVHWLCKIGKKRMDWKNLSQRNKRGEFS